MKRITARIIRKKPETDYKKIDEAYALGARTERLRILAQMDQLLYDNRGMDSWTALLSQCRDTLENHHNKHG